MSDERYFNFPIQLLEGLMYDPKEVMEFIFNYGFYEITLSYDKGSNKQKAKKARKFLGFTGGNLDNIYTRGEELYNSIPPNSPKVGINISILFDYLYNDKTEFQKLCLLGFLAIKSILQNKTYCKITNKFLWARMNGLSKSITDISELSEEIRKYANNYQVRKMKDELFDNWHLNSYAYYTRGFYVSFKLEINQLIFEVEKKKKSTKEKQRNDAIKNGRLSALKKLGLNK